MSETILLSDNVIYQEMLTHPALFTHPHPQKIAILFDNDHGILHEVLKHDKVLAVHCDQNLVNTDARIHCHPAQSFEKWPEHLFDILITTQSSAETQLQHYFAALQPDGIFIQASGSPFMLEPLINQAKALRAIGFSDLHIIQFPQPQSKTPWRSAIMALKKGVFKRAREKAIYNKTFKTQYYNHDIHRAALALPEFMRHEYII